MVYHVNTKTLEFVAEFIEIWHGEKSLWDVKNPVYKDRNAKIISAAATQLSWSESMIKNNFILVSIIYMIVYLPIKLSSNVYDHT